MKKKILAYIMTLCMLVGAMPATAWADEPTPNLTITTVNELKAFAAAVNEGDDFANKTVVLANDITFGENDYWFNNETGVDYKMKEFVGAFDGQGYTITGMKYYYKTANTGNDFTGPAMGLFGTVTGTVKNLTLDTVTAKLDVPSEGRPRGVFGFLAYSLAGEATDCHVKDVTVTTTGRIREAGGMFCGVSGTATDCTATNVSITTTSSQAAWTFEDMGGFAGVVTGELDDCSITGVTISGNPDRSNYKKVGGFIGRTNNDSVVTGCSATNVTIYANNQFDHVAGFVGHAENGGNATFTDCTVKNVTLTVDKTSSAKVGGFAGEAKGCTLTGCSVANVTINVGEEGGSYAIGSTSGFCGQTNGTGATFIDCTVTGLDMTLTGELENGVGGFLTSAGGAGATFDNCSVEGKIDATATKAEDAVGGFLGNLGWSGSPVVSVAGSSADVDIEANGHVGGFVGKADSNGSNAAPDLVISDCTASGDVTSLSGEANDFVGTGDTKLKSHEAEIDGSKYISLAAAFAAANADDTIKLLDNIDMTGEIWTSVDVKKAITIDGNNKTITGLKAPLINNSSADLMIKNLTITGANITVRSEAGLDNDTAAAALVQWANGGTLTLENVSVKNSTVDGAGYVAAMVGFVDSTAAAVNVTGGEISGNTLTAGGVVGTVTGLTYADVTVEDVKIINNTLTSTSDSGTRPDKVGLVVGRVVADTVSVSAAVEDGNVATPVLTNNYPVIGSLSGGTAVLTGGSYPSDPTVTGKEGQAVSVANGREIVSAEGKYYPAQKINDKVAVLEGNVTVNSDGSVIVDTGAEVIVNGKVVEFPYGGTIKADGAYVQNSAPSRPSSSSGSKKYSISKPDVENGSISVSGSAKKGSTVKITVKPDAGYELDELTVTDKNGNEIELKDNGDGTYSFTMPKSKVEIDAEFVEVEDAFVEEPVADETDSALVLTIGSPIVNVDSEYIVNDVAPIIVGERTMLPIRIIAEYLGATVEWDDAADKVTITKGDLLIEIFIGQPYALVNGTPVQLDAPAFIENGRTYLPVRFVADHLGAEVIWDDAARTVTIIPEK